MLKILQRKNWEPSKSAATNAYDKICSVDHQVMQTYLTKTLANVLCPISYKVLVENALGFMKGESKRYFDAAYIPLEKMIEGGSVKRIETKKGNEYVLTKQGRSAYEREQKKTAVGSKRNDDTSEQFSAFMESVD